MKYATLIISILIIIAVLIPGGDLPDVHIGGYDKVIHIMMFAAWAVGVRFDFDRTPFPYGWFFLLGVVFSAVSELLQLLVEGRSLDMYDMAADTAGLVAGFWISGPIVRLLNKLLGRTEAP